MTSHHALLRGRLNLSEGVFITPLHRSHAGEAYVKAIISTVMIHSRLSTTGTTHSPRAKCNWRQIRRHATKAE